MSDVFVYHVIEYIFVCLQFMIVEIKFFFLNILTLVLCVSPEVGSERANGGFVVAEQ